MPSISIFIPNDYQHLRFVHAPFKVDGHGVDVHIRTVVCVRIVATVFDARCIQACRSAFASHALLTYHSVECHFAFLKPRNKCRSIVFVWIISGYSISERFYARDGTALARSSSVHEVLTWANVCFNMRCGRCQKITRPRREDRIFSPRAISTPSGARNTKLGR